jgi:hypothetical protein
METRLFGTFIKFFLIFMQDSGIIPIQTINSRPICPLTAALIIECQVLFITRAVTAVAADVLMI